MKKKKFIIMGILLILLILIFLIIFVIKNQNHFMKKDSDFTNTLELTEKSNNTNQINDVEEIEKIKKELNSTGNTSIYKIEEEPDGRKILQIKNEVQFMVDLAGIIKMGKPEENELNALIEKRPKDTGIWISEQSRQFFLQLLKTNNLENFYITSNGFLKLDSNAKNQLEQDLQNMIQAQKQYIINMTGVSYERDYISGEIVEYPFEDIDPMQIIEPYTFENDIILEVTSNKMKKITDKEILESIIQYK